ncbi:glycosyltransferase family 2 protein [Lutispora saccharofermentans]|uniref:Glycosyltransferase family 2 protein n=1 Tax=Lutispora saccharofermentans TaxID=3024236 RepID=A0ABT1NIR8_9FIRM|nr:glycosyltransferase family 2 protein [Lutispora saccharofermentans]MCQ1531173.1 glycosyltransferase family 2 protein [Lutispora saccharofermentans]
MKVMVVVPAYNEEKNIYKVVASIKEYHPEIDVVVVNDGSKDNTCFEAKRAGAFVIDLPQNLGIGGAVQTGYLYGKRNDYDVVIQIDGDGQHDPKDISRLVEVIENKEADMVIGSRFVEQTEYESSSMRKLGINFFSRFVSFVCKQNFYDTTSGYRAANRKVIELFSTYYPKDYPEVETIVYAIKRGIRIKEVSVDMNKRQGGKSSITPLKSVYYMIKVTSAILLQP